MQRFTPARASRRLAFACALGVTTALGSLACGGGDSEGGKGRRGGGPPGRGGGAWGQEGGQEETALAVELVQIGPRDLVRAYPASGTLEAIRSAEIRPTQSGVLVSIEVEEGDLVKEDQVLARIDAREARLMASRDKLAAQNAERELERLDQLAKAQAAAKQELDQQRYALENAIASAKLSRVQASKNTVRAPFEGTITVRNFDAGNLATSADVIFELADLDTLELALHVPEREAGRVKIGAEVQLEDLAEAQFTGTIVRRAPVVDPLTGTVKFTVHSTGERPETAVPGAFVRAQIELESRDAAPALPKSAVLRIDERAFVFVIADGKAQRKEIEIGLEDGEWVEIRGGLEPGTDVVADTGEITDGMALKPFDPNEAKAPAAADASQPGKGRRKREAG